MALAIIISLSLVLEAAVVLICGKENFKGIITPLLVLWLGNFLLLCAEFVVGTPPQRFFFFFLR